MNPAEDRQVWTELHGLLSSLHERAGVVLGCPMDTRPAGLANFYHTELIRDDSNGQSAAREIAKYLIDERQRDDPAFWGTALGRALAWQIGWHDRADVTGVPRQHVQAILGNSRQATAKLLTRRVAITASELRAMVRERWARVSSQGQTPAGEETPTDA